MPPSTTPDTRTALVTGANRGLGQQVARDLAREGWNVLVGARDRAKGDAAAARIRKQIAGARARGVALDVSDPAAIADGARKLRDGAVRLSALVNNAGVYGEAQGDARFDEVPRVLAVNFHGPLRVTDALAPLLVEGANVVMVSSGRGALSGLAARERDRLAAEGLDRDGLLEIAREYETKATTGRAAGWPPDAYSASKALLNALTRVLATELAARGIRVNAVCPGWVRTDMGGRRAPRSVEEGAAGITWAATLGPDAPTGGFFRDGQRIPF